MEVSSGKCGRRQAPRVQGRFVHVTQELCSYCHVCTGELWAELVEVSVIVPHGVYAHGV